MERFTQWFGNTQFCRKAGLSKKYDGVFAEDELINELFYRLAVYEDTGLTPEEIKTVQDNLTPIPFSRYLEIMEAERAGRLVVSRFRPGDEIWAIERDEDGTAYDFSGHMFLAQALGYVIVSAYINDYKLLCETLDYHACETVENYETNLAVLPVCDVYGTRQEAEEALRKEADHA